MLEHLIAIAEELGVSLAALGGGSLFVTLLVAFVLYKVAKLALKIVFFIVVLLVLGVGSGVWHWHSGQPAPPASAHQKELHR